MNISSFQRGGVGLGCLLALAIGAAEPATRLAMDSIPSAQFDLTGPVGERVGANLENWLLRAPQANPGMVGMFRVRDRLPTPEWVPWAGEFVGKYLLSAIQSLRLTSDPRLREQIVGTVAELIATQAEDGYLGPFPQRDRLLKNWDLWGHYHAIQALVLWHQQSGDAAALTAARRAGDLVCRTYLNTGRRVLEAGDPEMNMSILTGMAMLHRVTGEPRYLQMAREVEKDWEKAGDYLRAGLDGREFYRSPRPRWESLHDLQGLVEMWRITGESRYRQAFDHHWRSIRRWDRRNTGGFSSGEQATGNPYAPTAIETCCTVAWTALTLDELRLTADPTVADDLECATLNGGLGAQHPSGRWWTYNTPMDGFREASAHTIVFQSRAGTPELNCCSVNGPRILGMLGEWSAMTAGDAIALSSYLPGKMTIPRPGGDVVLVLDRNYPFEDSQRVVVISGGTGEWTLKLRIPAWSAKTRVAGNFDGCPTEAKPGSYLEIRRAWRACDDVVLHFDMAVRAVPGANEAAGKVSLYRGPVLLAYDQAANDWDEKDLPAVDLTKLAEAKTTDPRAGAVERERWIKPWLQVEVPTVGGRSLRLVDFASAGAPGTRYRSWLAAQPAGPAPAITQMPHDGARLAPGPLVFQWRGPRRVEGEYRVEFSKERTFTKLLAVLDVKGQRTTVNDSEVAQWFGGVGAPVFWRVLSKASGLEACADVPPAWFQIEAGAPQQVVPPEPKLGPHGEVVAHRLRGEEGSTFGTQRVGNFVRRDEHGTEVNGRDQMLTYAVPAWPEEDFTVAVRVRIAEQQGKRSGQIFSGWAGGMDDPLRLMYDGGKIYARIEAGGNFSTPGFGVEFGRWYHVAAVKRGTTLRLSVDGQERGSCGAPEWTNTNARDCALGGNPHFSGNEFLAATFADFQFLARALSAEEIRALAEGR